MSAIEVGSIRAGRAPMRIPRRLPEPAWLALPVVCAWLVLLAVAVGAIDLPGMHGGSAMAGGGHGAMTGMGQMADMGATGDGGGGSSMRDMSTGGWALMWCVMVVAMMVPTVFVAVRHVGYNTLRRRRRRAVALFLAAYVGAWVLSGLVLVPLSEAAVSLPRLVLLLAAPALAVVWQLTPQKRAALVDCHRAGRLPLLGWRSEAGAARFGAGNGWACVRSCWPLMLLTMTVDGVGLLWVPALTGLVFLEKRAEHPARAARAGAALIVLAAAVLVPLSFAVDH